jgi:serine/threonine protein phosphatase PrpC
MHMHTKLSLLLLVLIPSFSIHAMEIRRREKIKEEIIGDFGQFSMPSPSDNHCPLINTFFAVAVGKKPKPGDFMTLRTQSFGVFDGHGPDDMAKYLQQNLLKNIESVIEKNKDIFEDQSDQSHLKCVGLLKNEFKEINDKVEEGSYVHQASGSTALIAVVAGMNLWVAFTGDSTPFMPITQDGDVRIYPGHKPFSPDEKQRIKENDGCVNEEGRISGDLFISRAFGSYAVGGIDQEPAVLCFDLKNRNNRWIVLASNGLRYLVEKKQRSVFIKQRSAFISGDVKDNDRASKHIALWDQYLDHLNRQNKKINEIVQKSLAEGSNPAQVLIKCMPNVYDDTSIIVLTFNLGNGIRNIKLDEDTLVSRCELVLIQ